ncbi:Ubiquitin domain [Macleaya cordata]|uniref:Ubiquitin domain n=1 Tax=Macleaya cordata TaxID=56857 RepID=A0A200QCJ8_MACCD|nr:Ubiquitin domain [Macleaya cordata]
MKVIIITITGEFAMEIGLKEPVLGIKQRIEQLLGVEVATQTLTVYGLELIDGLDMDDYPIVVEGTKIDLTIEDKQLAVELDVNRIQITLKISRRRINMEVDRTETVGSLKEKIHIIDGSSLKRLALSFSGIEMDENYRCLCEYGICEGSEISVSYKNEYGICEGSEISVSYKNANHRRVDMPSARRLSLVVQTSSSLLNSAKIPLEMMKSCTIREMRQILLDEKILPQNDYFFIHKQRIMQDDCSLRWHGVEDGDFLYVFKGTVSREY